MAGDVSIPFVYPPYTVPGCDDARKHQKEGEIMGATFDSVEELLHATKIAGELRMAICVAKTKAELLSDSDDITLLQDALEEVARELSETLDKHKL
ncbi:hypothetical protein RFN66_18770 [Bacillus paralicheniformis]|uniref:hypothetical protein n=2 Tax=Bacillaceae TaxID=186817 RepID=UPI002867CC80|nr:hypothetical protein [Bacillus paralicheniformis]WMW46644.1 hypothetical protein RFN66_18770 [Bacillus paralicheniformis]